MAHLRRAFPITIAIQLLGFASVIILTWLDEIYLLPRHIIPEWWGQAGWHEALLETVLVVIVCTVVVVLTMRLQRRLYYLESFIRMCAWCRKIDLDGKWCSFEEFFSKGGEHNITHGICQSCANNLKSSSRSVS